MEPVGGSMLGRYEVIRHLASGGMADLLLAKASGLEGFERHVVIKRIRADAEDDPAFIDMFLVEARLAGALHHHNIVQVHDVGEEKGKPYFAMEYVHGEDLRRLLATVVQKRQPLPLPVIVTIATAVARALHHAHEQKGSDQQPLGIVHRDVSPANIVVGYDGNVKVLDFGIARAAMRRTETQAGMLKGKAPYMAPEQCTGAPVDRRSDVFALGIVLYELATARRLFKAENDHLTMMTIVHGTIPKPSTIRKGLPPDLERIIMRALARDPGSRYQTAEQMFVALEQLAVTAEWRTSASVLASFMTQMFGSRTEPWLSKEPIAAEVSVDFDGPGTGVARPADNSGAVPAAVTPTTSSPISRTAPGPSGGPNAAEVAVSASIKIPNPSAMAATKSAAMKVALRAPVTATPPRGRPKTVQVPAAKSPTKQAVTVDMPAAAADAGAKTLVKSAARPVAKQAAKMKAIDPASLEETAPVTLPVKAATPDDKDDPSLDETAVLSPPVVALRPTTEVPTTRAAATTTEVTRVKRPATEVDPLRPAPVLDGPEETDTQAQALPPSVSPHPLRQLKPLPAPNVAKQIASKPAPSTPASEAATPGAANLPMAAAAVASKAASSAAASSAAASPAHVNGASNGKRADVIASPTMASRPLAAAVRAASTEEFTEDPCGSDTEIDQATEVAPLPNGEPPFAARRTDPTAIVAPLPSPMRTEPARARRKSTAPVDITMIPIEDPGELPASARPRWMLPAIGGGVLVLAIIVFAIARSGGDDALDTPSPEISNVTEPRKAEPAAAPLPDEVRTGAQPRTWANSQQLDPAVTPPAPEPTPPAPEPRPPAPEPNTNTAAAAPPTEPEPPTPTEPEPAEPAEPKPAVATAKPATKPPTAKPPAPKPVKPKAVPAITKTTKPAAKPATVAKTTKPAPKPMSAPKTTPTPKTTPKANWNPNSLFPNKK